MDVKKTNNEMSVADFKTMFIRINDATLTRFPEIDLELDDLMRLAHTFYVAYSASPRSYHGTAHPWNMLVQFFAVSKLRSLFQDHPYDNLALYWMIVGHDLVMEVGKEPGWNEAESGRQTAAYMKALGYPEWFCKRVERGINATFTHGLAGIPEDEQPTVAMLLDLDLMGLGQAPEEFAADTESIWLEYQPYITREQYNQGRQAWAAEFLKRPQIFHTDHFAKYERQARTNLHALANAS